VQVDLLGVAVSKNAFVHADGDEDKEDEEWTLHRGEGLVKTYVNASTKYPRESTIHCNIAKVRRPLACAAKVVAAGNNISMGPKPEESDFPVGWAAYPPEFRLS
jgi:hypothetical protein